jgi:hypothetical protein
VCERERERGREGARERERARVRARAREGERETETETLAHMSGGDEPVFELSLYCFVQHLLPFCFRMQRNALVLRLQYQALLLYLASIALCGSCLEQCSRRYLYFCTSKAVSICTVVLALTKPLMH